MAWKGWWDWSSPPVILAWLMLPFNSPNSPRNLLHRFSFQSFKEIFLACFYQVQLSESLIDSYQKDFKTIHSQKNYIFLVCICRNSFPFKNYSYWLSDSSWLMGYNYRTLFSFKYKQKISISNFKNNYDWGNDCFIAWRLNTILKQRIYIF